MTYDVQILKEGEWVTLGEYARYDASVWWEELTWETSRDNSYFAMHKAREYYDTAARVRNSAGEVILEHASIWRVAA